MPLNQGNASNTFGRVISCMLAVPDGIEVIINPGSSQVDVSLRFSISAKAYTATATITYAEAAGLTAAQAVTLIQQRFQAGLNSIAQAVVVDAINGI